jgi:hypothetical protein
VLGNLALHPPSCGAVPYCPVHGTRGGASADTMPQIARNPRSCFLCRSRAIAGRADPQTPIWKTITVGGSKGVNAIRNALETAPCHMAIADDADEILGRPAFPFIKTPVEFDLVVLSVFELGFGDQASLHDIYARAVALGFELCPAEVGLTLRLNYLDQPLHEFLHIAMKPVAKYNGVLIDFTITIRRL